MASYAGKQVNMFRRGLYGSVGVLLVELSVVVFIGWWNTPVAESAKLVSAMIALIFMAPVTFLGLRLIALAIR